ncbi:MAG TPA: substrate-binding domain-containing protein [Desulfobacteria bacterium]|nr:substrate-binding domain-containing protein [Desulfobacteria bacterium]
MIKKTLHLFVLLMLLASSFLSGCASSNSATSGAVKPANPDLILATTTSTQDSGLLDVLIPAFEKKTGYKVKTLAVGTGAALTYGKKGEADVLLVHAPKDEQKLVDSNILVNYNLVMHNDFIVVGPANDPANVKNSTSVQAAFKAIAANKSVFISRGDDSGTDKMEKSLWKSVDIKPAGSWYQESGSGMGQTLNIASDKQGYTLTDRATFLANQKNLKLEVVREGDKSLLNIYHVAQVNADKFPKVNKEGAKAFVDFMLSQETQKMIDDFGKDKYNQQLFFADAGKSVDQLGK